jgi:hypothetical protein
MCIALAAVLVLPIEARAQSEAGIAGVVRDTTGGVLPGVTVEASSPALIEKVRNVTTDSQGQYRFVDLRPGTYTIVFTLPGFGVVRREGIEVATGFTATINADLRPGALEETITVTGDSPVVDTQNTRSQVVLSREVLDTIPTGRSLAGYTALTLGATGQADVGGNKGEQPASMGIHGNRPGDMRLKLDGMVYNQVAAGGGSGGHRYYLLNQIGIREIVLETGGTAEVETGGVQLNAVPKDGGNTFSVHSFNSFSNSALQTDNLSDELRSRGLTSTATTERIYDFGAGLGGPLNRDKVWFYTAHRVWGTKETLPGNYFNATQGTPFYTPDFSRPAYSETWNRDHGVRLTIQATPKHRITASANVEWACSCYNLLTSALTNRAPEAVYHEDYDPRSSSIFQSTWTYPASTRLLFQAGISYAPNNRYAERPAEVSPTDIAYLEVSTGYRYGAKADNLAVHDYGRLDGRNLNSTMTVSYVSGSHAFKAGLFWQVGRGIYETVLNDPPVLHTLRKPTPDALPEPVSVTYFASPNFSHSEARNRALFVQDQWRIQNLTLNLGVRFDFLHAWNPAQTRPAGAFVPEFHFEKVDNVPNWSDANIRLGAAYDLFGDGRSALKVSFGRYVITESASLAFRNGPGNAIVTNAFRTWQDRNGDYVPQDDELGALSNNSFGTVQINTRYDREILEGFGVRPYNWQGSASFQQELRPGLAATVSYYRTWYGNFHQTDNLALTAADYDPFCVTAPSNPVLPGGGGYRVCDGLYDIKPQSFGLAQFLVTDASNFGDWSEVFNGVDLSLSARLGAGAMLQGGVSTGHTVVDNCAAATEVPAQFCRTITPWEGQTQIKLAGAYPLPWWDVQLSGMYQNLPGTPILATNTFLNSQLAPELGRNLGQCRFAATCNGTATISLVEPNTLFEKRQSQLDLRVTKTVPLPGGDLRAMIDVYNVFNANTVLSRVNTLGPLYGRPTNILAGRLFKFGVQVDF